MTFPFIFMMSLCGIVSLSADTPYSRYNRNKKTTPPIEKSTQETPPKRTLPLENEAIELQDDDATHFDYHGVEKEIDSGTHTPLGAICIDIQGYCSYYAHNCLIDVEQTQQKQSLELFCNLLELLANLADGECGIIRINNYLSNIVSLTQKLTQLSISDSAMLEHPAEYPFTTELVQSLGASEDIPCFMQHALRAPESAKKIIHTVFNELRLYAHYKLHAILETFERDTKMLLERAQSPELFTEENETLVAPQRQSMSALGWLCRHAASTCTDLAQTIPSSPLLARTSSLMNQVQLMLSTMALTYAHLGANTVRSQDRFILAKKYAHLIDQMGSMPSRRGSLSPLQYAQALTTVEEKQTYIEEVFTNKTESSKLLHELFPCFNDALDYNLVQFSTTLANEVIEVLSRRYWMEQQ